MDSKIIETIAVDPSFAETLSEKRNIVNEEINQYTNMQKFYIEEEFSESLSENEFNDDHFI